MSDADRQQTQAYISGLWSNVCKAVSESRKVISQSEMPNSKVEKGTVVVIDVSLGPEEEPTLPSTEPSTEPSSSSSSEETTSAETP